MSRQKGLVAKYAGMPLVELREATKEFDEDMVVDKSRPLTPAERRAWHKIRRKPGRPRKGAGVKVISVSVERKLLARCDALARNLAVSRASLIERGIRAVLEVEVENGGPRSSSSVTRVALRRVRAGRASIR